jgi:hypothetical protein
MSRMIKAQITPRRAGLPAGSAIPGNAISPALRLNFMMRPWRPDRRRYANLVMGLLASVLLAVVNAPGNFRLLFG